MRRTATIRTSAPDCPRGRSPTRARRASKRCSIRPRPRRSISSPTGPAGDRANGGAGSDQRLRTGLAPDEDRSGDVSLAGADRARTDVADPALGSGIAPRPAQAAVEQSERLAGFELADGLGILGRGGAKHRRHGELALEGGG